MDWVLTIDHITSMTDYNVDLRRWLLQMLPISLRRKRLMAFLVSALEPLVSLYAGWRSLQSDDVEFLQTTGQVCYIRGALQRRLPSSLNIRYRVDTAPREVEAIYALSEAVEGVLLTLQAGKTPVAYPESMFCQTINLIIVYVPRDIYDRNLADVISIVERYKLPSKQASYIRLTSN